MRRTVCGALLSGGWAGGRVAVAVVAAVSAVGVLVATAVVGGLAVLLDRWPRRPVAARFR